MSSSGSAATSAESPSSADSSVFLNCPYDQAFQPCLDALVLAVVACGLSPKSALEGRDASTPRISRILDATFTSRLSIHDLSKCRGEGDANLARFNMPLELGMAMAKRHADELAGKPKAESHRWLALVPRHHDYKLYVSDLGGFDLEPYDGSPEDIVAASMGWLSERASPPVPVSPRRVAECLPHFQSALARLRAEWYGREAWSSVIGCARETLAALV